MRKAISTTMEIIIAIVVILVAALILLSVFGVQLGPITGIVDTNTKFAACQTACTQYCFTHPDATTVVGSGVGASCTIADYQCNCKAPVVPKPA